MRGAWSMGHGAWRKAFIRFTPCTLPHTLYALCPMRSALYAIPYALRPLPSVFGPLTPVL